MTKLAGNLITATEFYDMVMQPENRGRHFELDRGEVIEMPPPDKFHGFVCGNVEHDTLTAEPFLPGLSVAVTELFRMPGIVADDRQ